MQFQRKKVFFNQKQEKLPQNTIMQISPQFSNYLIDITPRNVHTKCQMKWSCGFREKGFFYQKRENCPKNTIMQISPQFQLIWLRTTPGTFIPGFKLDLWFQRKRLFDQKREKLTQKHNYVNFSTISTNQTEITPINCHTKFQMNWTCGFRERGFFTKNRKNCPQNTI